mgnify:CR=1 FL=1
MRKNLLNIIFSFGFNLSLLIFLFLGIQNSKESKRIKFVKYETIELPISFIVGTSFIAGSLSGAIIIFLRGSKE